ncbi:hypothetical protein [Bacillus paranthracis]|uniref:hypothetical protein n=1 Tax=Bacillus paranthracis TaxID=2026186 RepID=UPI0009B456CA|nr:hypothetical protein [Bacillus paranthracis]
MINEIISTIFQIYRSQLKIYQRFFHYIDDSTRHIDLPTHNDKIKAPNHFEVNPENGTLIKTPKPLVP